MKTLNPKLVLDPLWICQANFVDLEYYTYVLLAAKQKYLSNLDAGFANFYEIVFHYLNLNTIIADKKVYDSQLRVNRTHEKLLEIVSQLAQRDQSHGKEIIKVGSKILSEVMQAYLEKQIPVLEHLHFHFNNSNIHKQDKIYIVSRTTKSDHFSVYCLDTKAQKPLGYLITKKIDLYLPELKHSEFKDRLLEKCPDLKDFLPEKNVIVVSGSELVVPIDGVCLIKDILLINKLMNPAHGFDANVLLDYNRMLEKKKSIPFKLKA